MRLHRRQTPDMVPFETLEDAAAGMVTESDDLSLAVEALESLPVGVVVEDHGGRVLAANQKAESPFQDLTANVLANDVVERTIARARAGSTATEVLDLHGSRPRRLEVTATPLEGGGVVAVVADVSERLRLEAVRRDFVANVNHELRTPIGALGVLAEALVGERDPATIERLAGRINAEVERALTLIEDLLDFSRVEREDQPDHVEVPLVEVIAAAEARVAARAERLNVGIVTSGVEAAPTIPGDRSQLTMAVTNLLENAVKYSDPGATVELEVAVVGGDAVISVADEGIGIPARDLDRVFERFYRVDAARDRRTGGSGLGLAIVRHVATNHGGTISVESQEGVGSTFTLRLPVGKLAAG